MRDKEAEAREGRLNRRVGEWLAAVSTGRGAAGLEGGRVRQITMRLPTEEDPSTLLVVKAQNEVGSYVSFVGAYNLADALLAWRARCKNDRMRWRENRPWEDRSGS